MTGKKVELSCTNETVDDSDLKRKISLVASVGAGQTISVNSLSIIDHDSLYTALSRYWYNENKTKTTDFIIETVKKSISFLQEDPWNKSQLDIACSLQRAKQSGIPNIIKTYQKYPETVSKLESCLETIQNFFIENHKETLRESTWIRDLISQYESPDEKIAKLDPEPVNDDQVDPTQIKIEVSKYIKDTEGETNHLSNQETDEVKEEITNYCNQKINDVKEETNDYSNQETNDYSNQETNDYSNQEIDEVKEERKKNGNQNSSNYFDQKSTFLIEEIDSMITHKKKKNNRHRNNSPKESNLQRRKDPSKRSPKNPFIDSNSKIFYYQSDKKYN